MNGKAKSALALLIRADASSKMGIGHVMRCMALAQAAIDAGGTATFAFADRPAQIDRLLKSQHIGVVNIDAAPGSPADAIGLSAIARDRQAAVVLDGYQFDASYQDKLKRDGLFLCCIDDYGHAAHYSADLVVNQNLFYADPARYHRRAAATALLLGTSYALIRREFRAHRRATACSEGPGRRILVTMGGSDAANMTLVVLEDLELLANHPIEVVAVAGGSNPHWPALQLKKRRSRLHLKLVQNADDMPALMRWADLAVSAGGMTSYELACMGLPALLVAATDVQAPVSRALHDEGISHYVGRAEDIRRGMIAETVEQLVNSPQKRHDMALRGRKMVDGEGARRVVENIAASIPDQGRYP